MYQMNPPEPPQAPQPQQRARLSVPQVMLIVLVLAFAAWYLITTLTPETAPYATITAGVIGSRYNGDCLIVREEAPYTAEGVTSIVYRAEEGETVYRGTTICNVYSSGFSTRETIALQEFRDQIKEYQLKLLGEEITTDAQMEKLESDVLNQAREVRTLIRGGRGNLSNQERLLANAIDLRQSYLKTKYSEDQRMSRLYDDEQSQLQRISSWTKQYTASGDGVVSFYSDGYEFGLTVNNYDTFTPAEVRAMLNGKKPGDETLQKRKTTIFRIVRDGRWYVLMLIRDSNWNPVEGETYDLRLENFRDTTVRATVTGFSRAGGELEVRLSVDASVEPVLNIRTCTGVLGDSVSSLTVPKKAIYTQDNMPGVVVVSGEYQVFIPVSILGEQDGMVYISGIQQGQLYEGLTVRLF